ncbi:MAG: glycosyltransferase family 4 protein [Acidobacteria bacterium]|nr:glycosyltransferase family 4 protein [Acidobacteriota bacterium]
MGKAGNEILIIVQGLDSEQQPQEWEGCTVLAWPSPRPTRLADAFFLWRILKQFKPDVIVANFAPVNLCMTLGWLARVPTRIAWYRTLMAQIHMDSSHVKWKRHFLRFRKSLVYRFATQLVAVSQKGKQELLALFKVPDHKIKIIHTCRIDPKPQYGLAKPSGSPLKIICVGRLHKSKGQDVLLRAVGDACQRLEPNSIQVTLVGDGPAKATLMDWVAENHLAQEIHFTGSIPHECVLQRLAQSDLAVFPIREDAGPGVLVEASAMGLPIIATRFEAGLDLHGNHSGIVWVEQEDSLAISEEITKILEEPDRLAIMGQASRSRFEEKFDMRSWVERVFNLLLDQRESPLQESEIVKVSEQK